MELRECLVCENEYVYNVLKTKMPEYSWSNDTETVLEFESIKNHLHAIFLLRKLLDIPEHLCCSFLEDYGNPSLWISCCAPCSQLVEKAKRVFQQIVVLQNEYEELQKKIKNAIFKSVKRQSNFKRTAKDTVRSYVSQEYENYVSDSTSKGEIITGLETEAIADFDCIPSDNLILETIFTETDREIEPLCVGDPIVKSRKREDPLALEDSSTLPFQGITDADAHSGTLESQVKTQKYSKSDDEFSDVDDTSSCSEMSTNDVKDHATVPTEVVPLEDGTQVTQNCSKNSERKFFSESEKAKMKILKTTCIKCGKKCKSFADLKIHHKTHKDWNPRSCPSCGKLCTTVANLRQHLRIHSEEKPYQCGDCGQGFKFLSVLRNHEKQHTGSKPHACNICGQKFTRAANCKKHIMICHSQIKKLICPVCGKTFRWKHTFNKHQKMHTIIS